MPRPRTDTTHLRDLFGRIDRHSDVAVYRQVETVVCSAIASGTLKAGEQLPANRELSEWLEVDHNTGAKAYRDLEVMGLVHRHHGRGVFVRKGVQGQCREKVKAKIIARIFEVCAEAKIAGMTSAEIKAAAKKCYKLPAAP